MKTGSRIKVSNVLTIVVAFMLLASFISPMVQAHEGGEAGHHDDDVTTSNSDDDSGRKARVEERVEELREKAQETREQTRQTSLEDSVGRTIACENRKEAIENHIAGLHERGTNFKNKVDSFIERLDNFVATNEIVVTDVDALVAAMEAAEIQAQDDLEVVRSLRAEIDCSDPDTVKDAVTAYKESVVTFKASAKAYLQTVKDYAAAIRSAVEEA